MSVILLIRKNLLGRILKEKSKKQQLRIVSKSCPKFIKKKKKLTNFLIKTLV